MMRNATHNVGECSSSTSASSQQDIEDCSMTAVLPSEEYDKLDAAVGRQLSNLAHVPHILRINTYFPNVSDASLDHQRLLQRLNVYGLYEVTVSGDGNCQFRALSDQIYRSPEYHKLVRKKVVKQLKDCRSLYESYVPMKYKKYCKNMAKCGEWGDHVTLQAAADKWHIAVEHVASLVGTDITKQYLHTTPLDVKSDSLSQLRAELWLSFWSGVHYNSLYKIQGEPVQHKPKKKHWLF